MFYQHVHAGTQDHFVKECGENFSFPAHMHFSFECILILEGEMSVTVSGKTELLRQGEAVLIFPNTLHALSSAASKHVLCIFAPELVAAYFEKVRGKTADSFRFRPSPWLVSAINGVSEGDSDLFKKGLLYFVCAEFDKDRAYLPAPKEEKDLLSKAFLYVEENYAEECSLSRLAQAVGYEYGYLSRYFKQKTGVSFSEYVNRYRINRACYLLSSTDKTVLDCAMSVGYDSFRTFTRNFKKTVGLTAEEYKLQGKTNRKQSEKASNKNLDDFK